MKYKIRYHLNNYDVFHDDIVKTRYRLGVVGLAEYKATQSSLARAWAELGNTLFRHQAFYRKKARQD